MKYVLKKDLPFAKIGDGHILELNEKSCDLIDKDNFRHPLSFGHELFRRGVQRLLEEGWVEEVKPREWILLKAHNGQIVDATEDLEAFGIGKLNGISERIKVREVLDDK